jgi:membrane-associated phospholipid phosphatase
MLGSRFRWAAILAATALLTAIPARDAHAQPDEPVEPVAAPHQERPPPPPPRVRTASTGEKTVPADEVSPDEIVSREGGRTVAAKPEVTPIIPEPSERPTRAYQLYWELDVSLLAVAIVLGGGSMIRTSESASPAYCVTQSDPEPCDKADLNPIDRSFAGRYSPGWSDASDYAALALAISPIAVLWPDGGFVNMLNDTVVVYQSALIAVALQGLSSTGTGRGRPYVYGDEAPRDLRQSPAGAMSYFSGHTTFAFATSTSLFWTVNRRHPGSAFAWTTFVVGTSVASFTGVGRILAGKHFPTDVLAGAAVGAGVGTLIPALHDSPVIVSLAPDGDGAMLTWFRVM